MRRWAFNIVASISLLLLLGTVWLWIRSYWVQDSLVTVDQQPYQSAWVWVSREVRTSCGTFGAGIEISANNDPALVADRTGRGVPPRRSLWRTDVPAGRVIWGQASNPSSIWSSLGFQRSGATATGSYYKTTRRGYTLPLWLPSVVFAIFPVSWLVRRARRRNRKHTGMCVACGYDLRASPDRCPECGTVAQGGTAHSVG